MPTQAEIDERIAKELLKQPRAEPAGPPERAEPDPITEPEAVPADPVGRN